MKLATIALAIAFAFPSTLALARGGMSFGSHGARGVTVGATGRIATKPMNASGNTLGIMAHNPSGSTLTPSAMNRGG